MLEVKCFLNIVFFIMEILHFLKIVNLKTSDIYAELAEPRITCCKTTTAPLRKDSLKKGAYVTPYIINYLTVKVLSKSVQPFDFLRNSVR